MKYLRTMAPQHCDLQYAAELLVQLRRMTDAIAEPFLTHLIDMAATEATERLRMIEHFDPPPQAVAPKPRQAAGRH